GSRRIAAAFAVVTVIGGGVGGPALTEVQAQTGVQLNLDEPLVVRSELHTFRVVTVAEGLDQPWSIAFLPEGDVLVTEKPGRLRVIRNGTLLPDPIPGTPEVRAEGQGGLLEVL